MEATMHSAGDVHRQMHSRLLAIRALERILSSEAFHAAYEAATSEQRDIVNKHIGDEDQIAVEKWIAIYGSSNNRIECMPVVELRRYASRLGIRDYQYMSKASLLSAITQRLKQNGTA